MPSVKCQELGKLTDCEDDFEEAVSLSGLGCWCCNLEVLG